MRQVAVFAAFTAWVFASIVALLAFAVQFIGAWLSGNLAALLSNFAANWAWVIAIYVACIVCLSVVLIFCGFWELRRADDLGLTKRWRDYQRERLSKLHSGRRKRP